GADQARSARNDRTHPVDALEERLGPNPADGVRSALFRRVAHSVRPRAENGQDGFEIAGIAPPAVAGARVEALADLRIACGPYAAAGFRGFFVRENPVVERQVEPADQRLQLRARIVHQSLVADGVDIGLA